MSTMGWMPADTHFASQRLPSDQHRLYFVCNSRNPFRNQPTARIPMSGGPIWRAVITRGAGFIGSHLCERFLSDGHDVICVDNLLTGTPRNIAHLMDQPRFQFVQHNVSEPIEIAGPVDNVSHFASPASPADYLAHPTPTLMVGSLGTHNALGLANAKDAQFLLASTSAVY